VDAAELLRALALQLTSLQQQRHEILLSAIEPSFSLFVCHFGRVCDDCKGLPIQDAQRDYEVLESREVCPDTGNELNALLDLAELIAELTMSRSSRDNVTKTVVIRAISSSQKALLRQKADLRRWIVDPEPEFKVIDSGYQCGRCEKPME
jgi:hypothetical protein